MILRRKKQPFNDLNMKKALFPIFILIIWLMIKDNTMNAQTFFWSNQIGSEYYDSGGSGCCDNEGNFYFAGGFQGIFCYFQTDTLVRHGVNDLFLVKYDPTGKELWVRQIGGWNEESFESIEVNYDNVSNHIFISGSFYGAVSFGSCIMTSRGRLDIFLLKYNLDGNCVWGTQAGGDGDDEASKIAFDKNGCIYMCGSNSLTANFDDFEIPRGGFLAKFNQDGKCQWAKNKFAWSQIRTPGLKIFDSDIIVGGCLGVDDTVRIDTIVIAHKGFCSSLICCFDSKGDAKWLREGISLYTESVSDIAIDVDGNIFQTGYFVDSINFSGTFLASKTGKQEMFLVKYDKTGKPLWARQTVSSYYAEGFSLSTDRNGKITVTGHYSGTTRFDDFQVKSISNEDMFMTSYDNSGKCLGAYSFGNGLGSGICNDTEGNPYFTYLFSGSTSLGSKVFNSYGGTDIIIAKCSAITGLEEPPKNEQNTLLIYANPNTGKCNITIPDEFKNDKNLRLQIFDNKGRLIQQSAVEIAEDKIKLNIEAQAKGMYTAILSNGKKSYSGKIVFK